MTQPEGKGKEVGLWSYNDLDSNPGSAVCWKDTFKLINLSESQFPYVQIGQNKLCLGELLRLEMIYIKCMVDTP